MTSSVGFDVVRTRTQQMMNVLRDIKQLLDTKPELVAGIFKNGKSTLLNAMLGDKVRQPSHQKRIPIDILSASELSVLPMRQPAAPTKTSRAKAIHRFMLPSLTIQIPLFPDQSVAL
jgi:hypothetical protein